MLNQTGGTIAPDSNWCQASVIVAGDAVGTANQVRGVRINPPRDLRYRRLYVAAFTIPDYRTGYSVEASVDCRFVLTMKNDQTEFLKWEWNNDNSIGTVWPTSTQRSENPGLMRPQFRVSNRQQQQPFALGWVEPMMKDGIDVILRTQDAAPGPTALEWMVSCVPFCLAASINEITIDADKSTLVTPDQLAFFVGCLSSDNPL